LAGVGRLQGVGVSGGLGSEKTQAVAMQIPGIVGGVLTAPGIVGATTAAGGGTIGTALLGSLAVPVIGAAVAGVTIALYLIFARKGPKQKTATTNIVDQVEPALRENVQGYLAGPRTVSSQRQAIANFEAGWAYVVEYCDTPAMGEPGKRCVNERKEGARPSWGQNWFEMYLDPIRNDTQVKPDNYMDLVQVTDPVTGTVTYQMGGGPASSVFGDGNGVLLLAGAGLLAAIAVMGDN
jgi:hypothetical protein